MVIIFDKKNGEIIASFPEAYSMPKDFFVTKENRPKSDFEALVVPPNCAWFLENPYHPEYIHDYKVEFDKKGKAKGILQYKNKDKYEGQKHDVQPHKPL